MVDRRHERHVAIREQDADDKSRPGLDQVVREIGGAAMCARRLWPLELLIGGEERLAFVIAMGKRKASRSRQRGLDVAVSEKRRPERDMLGPVEEVVRLPRVSNRLVEVHDLLVRTHRDSATKLEAGDGQPDRQRAPIRPPVREPLPARQRADGASP